MHTLLSTRLRDGRHLCVAPVPVGVYESNQADALGGDTGYFIFEFDEANPQSGVEVLGKAASYDAASRLVDIYRMATEQIAPPAADTPPTAGSPDGQAPA